MNKEDTQYIDNFILEINDNIARLVSKMDDTILEIWKIDKKDILEVVNFKEKLIKYIEDKIKKIKESICDSKDLEDIKAFNCMKDLMLSIYQDLLKRIKSNNYEDFSN